MSASACARCSRTDLVNTVVESGTGFVTVDLAGEPFDRIDPADQRAAIAQIVLTLVGRPGVGQVTFTLDGEPMRVPRADGLQSEPGELVSPAWTTSRCCASPDPETDDHDDRPRPRPRLAVDVSYPSVEPVDAVGPALPVLVDLDPQHQVRPLRAAAARARSPTCLSTCPPRPMTMPFWLSRSTMISTVMRSPSHSATRVAIEYGSSSRVTASSCSRTSSATHCSSGTSRTVSLGKYAGPSGSRATRCSTSAATPSPVLRRHREVGLGVELGGGRQLGEHAGHGSADVDLVDDDDAARQVEVAGHPPVTVAERGGGVEHEADDVDASVDSSTLPMAVALTLRPSAVTGLCKPGVSTNTSWASGRVSTPRTRWRVVCGLSETMLTFSPQIVLTSDDLPTLGRPTIVTNPERTRAF